MTARTKPDYRLLVCFGVLLIFGLAVLSSASAVVGFERFGDSYYFLKRQLLAVFIGMIFFLVLLGVDYRRLQKFALPTLVVSVVMLMLVFTGLGQSYSTFARRWIRLGIISFQPSEIIKLVIIVYLAAWLAGRGRRINDFKGTFLPFIGVLAAVCGLVILQPDIGTAFMIAVVAISVFFLSGGRIMYILGLGFCFVIALIILLQFKTHAADRFKIYLHPELDPKGIGYQINQAYLAIGSGGLLGRGFGQSRAKFQYLPEVYGDSIFAVIAEEMGFIVVAIFLLLLLYILWRGLNVTRDVPDDFGRLLGGGIVLWLIEQSLVNISAMIGLVPLTGIPLPFISYGSSAMVTTLAAIGILANITTHRREI